MKIKTIIIAIVIIIATYVVAINLYDLYTIYEVLVNPAPAPTAILNIGGPPLVGMSASAFGISAVIENSDTWSTVAKVITTVLGTYLGIKIINKYIKK